MSKPEIVLKTAVGQVEAVASENPNGEFHVILSTSSLDRDGETIEPGAFDPLPEHITFDIDHGLSVRSVVGSGRPFYADAEKTRVEVKGTYASTPLAQETRALINEGHIRTTSVAMKATKTKSAEGKTMIPKAELYNGSFVAVPANPEALVLSSKSADVKAGARHSSADLAHIQAAHDAMCSLGADCAAVKTAPPAEVKSIVGSVEALRDRVQDALADTYPGKYTCIRGVIPSDGGGTVVFDTPNDDWDLDSYQQTYTDDGNVVTLTGTPAEVDVLEIVVPDADAARDEQVDSNPLKSATLDEHDEVVAADAATDAAKAATVTAEAAEATENARARVNAHRNALLFARR